MRRGAVRRPFSSSSGPAGDLLARCEVDLTLRTRAVRAEVQGLSIPRECGHVVAEHGIDAGRELRRGPVFFGRGPCREPDISAAESWAGRAEEDLEPIVSHVWATLGGSAVELIDLLRRRPGAVKLLSAPVDVDACVLWPDGIADEVHLQQSGGLILEDRRARIEPDRVERIETHRRFPAARVVRVLPPRNVEIEIALSAWPRAGEEEPMPIRRFERRTLVEGR